VGTRAEGGGRGVGSAPPAALLLLAPPPPDIDPRLETVGKRPAASVLDVMLGDCAVEDGRPCCSIDGLDMGAGECAGEPPMAAVAAAKDTDSPRDVAWDCNRPDTLPCWRPCSGGNKVFTGGSSGWGGGLPSSSHCSAWPVSTPSGLFCTVSTSSSHTVSPSS
jgi:hypothetical protein